MMAQNVQMGHFRRILNLRLAGACFQAIRTHKEGEKYQLLLSNLTGDCQPEMEILKSNIEEIADKEYRLRKLRALGCLSKHVITMLGSYFN
jgi:CRISPR/Cas system-associated endonuclease Cas3-HD